MQNIEIPYVILRLWVGGYFIYWGFNGFFGWAKIPPNSVKFESFIGWLMALPVVMTVVKVVEIGAGLALVMGQVALGLSMLLPIVCVIVASHLILNFALGWRVALVVLLPFATLSVLFLSQ